MAILGRRVGNRQPATEDRVVKFEIQQEELQRALDVVANVAPAKTTMPILTSLLFEVGEGRLKISATNLDISIVTSTDKVDIKTAGKAAIPASKVVPFVRSLSPGPVTLVLKGKQIRLDGGKARLTENTMNAEEYPALKQFEEKNGLVIDAHRLIDMINDTVYAVSRDETRPALVGILWEIRPDTLTLVATDAHRLARSAMPVSWASAPAKDLIVDSGGLRQLIRIVSAMRSPEGEVPQVTIFLTDNQLTFRAGDTVLHTRLIDGPFPDYKAVIPADNDKHLVVDRAEFNRAIRRVSITADRVTNQVKLSIQKGKMELTARGGDGSLAEDEIPVSYAAEPVEIGFNYGYLQDILKNIRTDSVELSLRDQQSAALVKPVTEAGDDTGVLCLLMPLRLAGE
jgi:DNA polymerase-3 subunit beta